ncbi:Uncharacterized protein Adt_46333 [Abeliophyllum distichum]|uniref:Transposase (putative) gypsy type domain-containing protein n=1 Tax=Abeliophyllum distichum TaxID=126358 RepID=A0ABD1P0W3_9LAMI
MIRSQSNPTPSTLTSLSRSPYVPHRLRNIPRLPSTYNERKLERIVDHFFLSHKHSYRAPRPTEYLPTGRPRKETIYQDSLKAGLRFLLHPFLVDFFCTFYLAPGQLVPNVLKILNYYLMISLKHNLEPSLDLFRILFEMKILNRYNCFMVFSHHGRGLPAHDHFKIPNCPSSNSGWKNRYFFISPDNGTFSFPVEWSPPPLGDFNKTHILSEFEIDYLIIIHSLEPLARSMNDVLTDDALVSVSIGRPYDKSADQFSEEFLEELARKNERSRKKRKRVLLSAENLKSFRPLPSHSTPQLLNEAGDSTLPLTRVPPSQTSPSTLSSPSHHAGPSCNLR